MHLFGNAPSPAIATFGLRHTADDGKERYGKQTNQFVQRNFYVNVGLSLCPTENGAINQLRNTQAMVSFQTQSLWWKLFQLNTVLRLSVTKICAIVNC